MKNQFEVTLGAQVRHNVDYDPQTKIYYCITTIAIDNPYSVEIQVPDYLKNHDSYKVEIEYHDYNSTIYIYVTGPDWDTYGYAMCVAQEVADASSKYIAQAQTLLDSMPTDKRYLYRYNSTSRKFELSSVEFDE